MAPSQCIAGQDWLGVPVESLLPDVLAHVARSPCCQGKVLKRKKDCLRNPFYV